MRPLQRKSGKRAEGVISAKSGKILVTNILTRNVDIPVPVQSLSRVRLFATSWTTACQASLIINNSWSSLKLTSIESVMHTNHLILCRHLLLLPSIFVSIRVFSNEPALHIRWPKYWSFTPRALGKVENRESKSDESWDCHRSLCCAAGTAVM